MLIGLNGRLKSGKDTAYTIIKELRPEAERVSFAGKLKESAAASLGLDVQTLEELKGKEDVFYRAIDDEDCYKFNVRQYLQWFGTEGHRDVFGDNFWVDQALPLDLDHSDRLLVVTDMRFPNEAQRVIDLGGITAKVERETATAHADHASEQNIDDMCDFRIDNTGTLYELREEIRSFLEEADHVQLARNPGFRVKEDRPFPTTVSKPVRVRF